VPPDCIPLSTIFQSLKLKINEGGTIFQFAGRQPLNIATGFQVFDVQHTVTLGMIAVLCLLTAKAARSESLSGHRGLRWLIGFVLLAYGAFFYIQQGIEGALTWEYSLPLDLCTLVLISCIISLFGRSRFFIEIAYFWGLGGVVQATVTPDLARGFPSLEFMLFFWSHGAILIAIVFLIAGRDFKPRKGSVLRMMIALNIYALVVGATDAIFGWNYGYLCRKPAAPSLLDFLGPWPWYLISLELIAFLTFSILDLPWRWGQRFGSTTRN
jgi:hypothetical integral membrane protein (TIGR02206 family)